MAIFDLLFATPDTIHFGPKRNPFAEGRQVKSERFNAISVKKDSLVSAAKR
jgi:hypothetical protein